MSEEEEGHKETKGRWVQKAGSVRREHGAENCENDLDVNKRSLPPLATIKNPVV